MCLQSFVLAVSKLSEETSSHSASDLGIQFGCVRELHVLGDCMPGYAERGDERSPQIGLYDYKWGCSQS